TTVHLPETDARFPEIERLWALGKIEEIELHHAIGKLSPKESASAIADLGVAYQLVTDESSMIVLNDAAFDRYGIERRNKNRTAIEHAAQNARRDQPVQPTRADAENPMFQRSAPRIGGGGGGGSLSGQAVFLMIVALIPLCLLNRRSGKSA